MLGTDLTNLSVLSRFDEGFCQGGFISKPCILNMKLQGWLCKVSESLRFMIRLCLTQGPSSYP